MVSPAELAMKSSLKFSAFPLTLAIFYLFWKPILIFIIPGCLFAFIKKKEGIDFTSCLVLIPGLSLSLSFSFYLALVGM